METGQIFASGLKVLVKVSIEFHELYGYSLTVLDIDPACYVGRYDPETDGNHPAIEGRGRFHTE